MVMEDGEEGVFGVVVSEHKSGETDVKASARQMVE
jgi:hypothetical protein